MRHLLSSLAMSGAVLASFPAAAATGPAPVMFGSNGIQLLSGYLRLWTPGSTYDNGTPTALGVPLLDFNLATVAFDADRRTLAQEIDAYDDDRRNQSYSTIDGLGPLTGAYLAASGATTTIPSFDAAIDDTTLFSDNGTGPGVATAPLGAVVTLVNTLRGPNASTTPSKDYFNYERPFRQSLFGVSLAFVVPPPLVPSESPTPATDGAFPSGHTNAAYLTAFAMAYAIPERFQELITRASELGNDRILAGMHSPLDVVGGRDFGTFTAINTLADPANAALLASAYAAAHAVLPAICGSTLAACAHPTTDAFTPDGHPDAAARAAIERTLLTGSTGEAVLPCAITLDVCNNSTAPSPDRFADRTADLAAYEQRLTYAFPTIDPPEAGPLVPPNAEVVLATRLPYLSATQRRDVIASTEIGFGYPVLDDPDGYGRLDYFRAADGYARFATTVSVTMDAAAGGFAALDAWRNDIDGPGGLIKNGAGTLVLAGRNAFTGGLVVDGGVLAGTDPSAFGNGSVAVGAATLQPAATSPTAIRGALSLEPASTLELGRAGGVPAAAVAVAGSARLAGRLVVHLPATFDGTMTLLTARSLVGRFASVAVTGLPAGRTARLDYAGGAVLLVD